MKRLLLLLFTIATATVTDIDGNVYETVLIGDQLWMAENLKVTHYNDGSEIPTGLDNHNWLNTKNGAFTTYNNNADNSLIYGNLYNRHVISDDNSVCPENWHIPSEEEYEKLFYYLKGKSEAGGKLKDKGFTYWLKPNFKANNETGFSSKGSGYFNEGKFIGLLKKGYYWTSSDFNNTIFLGIEISYDKSDVKKNVYNTNNGMSIRCIANEIIEGCTDPDASNYNSIAQLDDGSCCVELWGECYNINNTSVLDLSSKGIQGKIPASICNLKNLTQLKLHNNKLKGEIPPRIGKLENLTYLSLAHNELSGEVPKEIGNLKELLVLSLYDNLLSGELPNEIGELIKLIELKLGFNQFMGEFPNSIKKLTNLTYLNLQDNLFTGLVPDFVCELNINWENFNSFDIDNNQFCPPYKSCIKNYIGYQDTKKCLVKNKSPITLFHKLKNIFKVK